MPEKCPPCRRNNRYCKRNDRIHIDQSFADLTERGDV